MSMFAMAAAAALQQSQFGPRMNEYMACLMAGLPADMPERSREEKIRLYEAAAAQCGAQREAAIAAAVAGRGPGTSEAEARALAVDIIDTLDPRSSERIGR